MSGKLLKDFPLYMLKPHEVWLVEHLFNEFFDGELAHLTKPL